MPPEKHETNLVRALGIGPRVFISGRCNADPDYLEGGIMGIMRLIGWLPLSIISMAGMSGMILFIYYAVSRGLPVQHAMLGVSSIFIVGFAAASLWDDPLLLIFLTAVSGYVISRVLTRYQGQEYWILFGYIFGGGFCGIIHNLAKYSAIHISMAETKDCSIVMAIVHCTPILVLAFLSVAGHINFNPVKMVLVIIIIACISGLYLIPDESRKVETKAAAFRPNPILSTDPGCLIEYPQAYPQNQNLTRWFKELIFSPPKIG